MAARGVSAAVYRQKVWTGRARARLGRNEVAVDPARVRARLREAEQSARPVPGVGEARAVLQALAVEDEGQAHEEVSEVRSADLILAAS
jgi:hypothetical protein